MPKSVPAESPRRGMRRYQAINRENFPRRRRKAVNGRAPMALWDLAVLQNPFIGAGVFLMEDFDSQIVSFLGELGISTTKTQGASEYFNVTTYHAPAGPFLNVVRPKKESQFYVIAMNIAIHESHQDKIRAMDKYQREEYLNQIKYALLSLNVDFAFLPQGSELPTNLQLEKIMYAGGDCFMLDFFENYTLVRNAGLYVITKFMEKFGPVGAEHHPSYM